MVILNRLGSVAAALLRTAPLTAVLMVGYKCSHVSFMYGTYASFKYVIISSNTSVAMIFSCNAWVLTPTTRSSCPANCTANRTQPCNKYSFPTRPSASSGLFNIRRNSAITSFTNGAKRSLPTDVPINPMHSTARPRTLTFSSVADNFKTSIANGMNTLK